MIAGGEKENGANTINLIVFLSQERSIMSFQKLQKQRDFSSSIVVTQSGWT